jgi:TRAP-type mannitol/chloroaromatic compound transport system permease large subunit
MYSDAPAGTRIAHGPILVLLGSFTLLCALGVPVAYALGSARCSARCGTDIPLEAVMLRISDGTDDFVLLAIPFFVLAGGIMAEGGMAARLVMLAKVFVGFIRGGMAVVNVLASTLFGCISGSSVADTSAIGSVMIPQMVQAGLHARVRDQCHHLRLGAGAADPALAQRGDLLGRRRRHDLGREPVPRRRVPGA